MLVRKVIILNYFNMKGRGRVFEMVMLVPLFLIHGHIQIAINGFTVDNTQETKHRGSRNKKPETITGRVNNQKS